MVEYRQADKARVKRTGAGLSPNLEIRGTDNPTYFPANAEQPARPRPAKVLTGTLSTEPPAWQPTPVGQAHKRFAKHGPDRSLIGWGDGQARKRYAKHGPEQALQEAFRRALRGAG